MTLTFSGHDSKGTFCGENTSNITIENTSSGENTSSNTVESTSTGENTSSSTVENEQAVLYACVRLVGTFLPTVNPTPMCAITWDLATNI